MIFKNVFYLVFFGVALTSCADHSASSFSGSKYKVDLADSLEHQPKRILPNIPNTYNGKIISLREAIEAIVRFHPKAKVSQSFENSAKEMIALAQSAYYPQINAGTSLRRENQTSNRYDKEYLQDMNIGISQVLYDFGKIASSVKNAENDYVGSVLQSKITDEELRYLAAVSVVTAERFQKIKKLSEQQVESVKSLSDLVGKRHEEGASNLSDVYQAKSRLDDVLSEKLNVSTQYQSTIRNLSLIIRQSGLAGATVGHLPIVLNEACILDSNWDVIPTYQLAEIEAEKALIALEKAKADELPTISLNGQVSKPLNASPRYGDRLDTTISLNVTVPLYQGGALTSNKNIASSNIAAAEARKQEVRLEIEQLISESKITLNNLKERNGLLNDRVNNLENTKTLYKQQYLELGTRTLVDLLNSEQEFYRAKVEAVNNQLDIIQTQLSCAYHQGKLGEYLK